MCRWKVNIEKTKSKNFESYSPFGFTLIELIAVILVLGVIALIATSTISGIIEKARKGAAEQSARSYLSGLHNYIVLSNANSDYRPLKSNSTYNITKNTTMGEEAYQPINSYVELKGYKPTGLDDYISLNSEYTISDGKLTINGYQITIKDDEITQSIKGEKIDIESLSLEMTNTSMEKGTSFTLNANISPSNASDQRLKYSSSDSSIVSVDPFGLVKAIKVGNATITVESLDNNQKKASLDISVISSATGITLNKTSTTISLGNSETLVATLAPSDTTTSGVNWSSSPTGIVNIANGVVTAIKVGTTTVTATTTNGKTASANITVDNPATSVTLNTTSATIYKGETVNLTASLVPSNSTTSSAVVWSSNANSVASVNTSGVVTALNPGTATITATTANGKTASAVITVIYEAFANGTAVYFNPTTGVKCTSGQAISTTGTKSGCMKWYVFNDVLAASKMNVLLDHNTTATVAYNSTGNNTTMKEAATQLASDIAGWNSTIKANARLISPGEISEIVNVTNWNALTMFFFETKTSTAPSTYSNAYGWLNDRVSTNCTVYGCLNNSDAGMTGTGYWAFGAYSGNTTQAWRVGTGSNLSFVDVTAATNYGVRPVIMIAKTQLH